jgi:hypothetical protein
VEVAEKPVAPKATAPSLLDFKPVQFRVVIASDPDEEMEGRYEAEVSSAGLELWCEEGERVRVPVGSGARLRHRGTRFAIDVDGRWLELAIIDAPGSRKALTKDVVEFLAGRAEQVSVRGRWPWYLFVPVALAVLLPLPGILWSQSASRPLILTAWLLLGILTAGLAGLLILPPRWPVLLRGLGAGTTFVLGCLALGAGLLADRLYTPPPVLPASVWQVYAPPLGRYRILMPGQPAAKPAPDLPGGSSAHVVELTEPKATFLVAHTELGPAEAGLVSLEERFAMARQGLMAGKPNSKVENERILHPGWLEGREWTITLQGGEATVVCRMLFDGQRLYTTLVSGRNYTPDHPDVVKFLNSLRLGSREEAISLDPAAWTSRDLERGGIALPCPGTPLIHVSFRDDRSVIGIARNGAVLQYTLADRTPRLLGWLESNEPLEEAAVSPNGLVFVARGNRGSLTVLSLEQPRLRFLPAVGAANQSTGGLAFSPKGVLASGHRPTRVALTTFDRAAIRNAGQIDRQEPVRAVAWSGRDELLAVGSTMRSIRLYTGPEHRLRSTLPAPSEPGVGLRPGSPLSALDFSPDGSVLAAALSDRNVRLWNPDTQQPLRNLEHPDAVTALTFLPSGRFLLTGCTDGWVRVWDSTTGQKRGSIRTSQENTTEQPPLPSLSCSPSSQYLAVAAGEWIEVWDLHTAVPLGVPDRPGS